MKIFAQIKDNKVINIFDWKEKKDPVIKDILHVDITSHKDKENIQVGWDFEDEEFKEPKKPVINFEKQKEIKTYELRQKAKEEILDCFLDKYTISFAEIAEEVRQKFKSEVEEIQKVEK